MARSIGSAGRASIVHRYQPDTNVLETMFHAPTGTVALRDLMPVVTEEEKRVAQRPEHEILWEVEVLTGEVEIEVHYAPRPWYGAILGAFYGIK